MSWVGQVRHAHSPCIPLTSAPLFRIDRVVSCLHGVGWEEYQLLWKVHMLKSLYAFPRWVQWHFVEEMLRLKWKVIWELLTYVATKLIIHVSLLQIKELNQFTKQKIVKEWHRICTVVNLSFMYCMIKHVKSLRKLNFLDTNRSLEFVKNQTIILVNKPT